MNQRLIQVGDAAPVLTLPEVNREGSVTLTDYRGHKPVLLGLFRGLHCPFCRHHLRWRYLEAARRPEDIGKLPTEADQLVAGGALAG